MRRIWGERLTRLAAGFFTALAAVATVTGYVGLGGPWKAAGVVLAMAIGLWLYKGGRSPNRFLAPSARDVVLTLALAGLVGFAWAWHEERLPSDKPLIYVVVPDHLATLESVAPRPETETFSVPEHRYGDHVQVDCYTIGTDHHRWYRLQDGYFMPGSELFPLPLTSKEAPACEKD